MMKKKNTTKKGGFGYVIVGSLVVMAVLFCILVITGSIAPIVLGLHVGDAPAMMTMPIFAYCLLADFVLLEVIFLCFMPGIRKFIDGEPEQEQLGKGKKKLPLSVIVTIVCCALLLCSIIIAPNVCYVMTEQGVDSYVFVKTDSHAWEDIPLYELTVPEQGRIDLYIFFTKSDKISMLEVTKSFNSAFTEKYGSVYGFVYYVKEKVEEYNIPFKVSNASAIEHYYKDSADWETIEKLIQ